MIIEMKLRGEKSSVCGIESYLFLVAVVIGSALMALVGIISRLFFSPSRTACKNASILLHLSLGRSSYCFRTHGFGWNCMCECIYISLGWSSDWYRSHGFGWVELYVCMHIICMKFLCCKKTKRKEKKTFVII